MSEKDFSVQETSVDWTEQSRAIAQSLANDAFKSPFGMGTASIDIARFGMHPDDFDPDVLKGLIEKELAAKHYEYALEGEPKLIDEHTFVVSIVINNSRW